MVAQHEQQHDETMLITHQLRSGPAVLSAPEPPEPTGSVTFPAEVLVPGGAFTMGTSTEPWALDNERPSPPARGGCLLHRHGPGHVRRLPGLHRGRRLHRPTLVGAGGLGDDPRTRPDGAPVLAPRRRAVAAAALRGDRTGTGGRAGAPCQLVRGGRLRPLGRSRRLPTEPEWEKAARHDPGSGRSLRYPWGDEDPTPDRANLGQRHLRPAAAGAYAAGRSPAGAGQLIGDVWEWTSSDFLPYPGFVAFPYREYSEVFFGPGHKVLRGGSFAVDPVACRGTFRNWDLPVRRQIFSGFRTARDA